MSGLADVALWGALAVTGLLTGALFADVRRGARTALTEYLLLGAATASIASLCARAGQILGEASMGAWVAAFLPIDAGPLSRLAILWATVPGGALTVASILLVWLALSPRDRYGSAGVAHALVVSLAALAALGVSLWFAPGPGQAGTIPPFAQDASAAVAPLLALAGATLLGWGVASALTLGSVAKRTLYLAWTLATGAIALEQLARSALGISPRDVVSLGSASSGLVLWLLASGLLHGSVRRRLFRTHEPPASQRPGAILAHAGAVCVVASFALHAVAARSNVILPPGQAVALNDAFGKPWQLVNQGVSQFDDAGAEVTSLTVEARSPNGRVHLLNPEIREYHGIDGQHLANGILRRRSTRGPVQALRILFTEADSLDAGHVRVTFIPVPILWTFGIAMLGMAAVAGLVDRQSPSARVNS